MFIKNKYHDWYMQLCNSRQKLNRVKSKNQYFESHHIIPRSLGGSNKKTNLVLLTAREHFIAHLLLTKFTTGKDRQKMIYAFNMMCITFKKSSKLYQQQRKLFSELQSKNMRGSNNSMYNKKHNDNTKKKMSNSKLGARHPKFNGYYVTPFGKLESSREIINHTCKLSYKTVQKWCNNSDIKINEYTYNFSKFLKELDTKENIVGKTFKELNFYKEF